MTQLSDWDGFYGMLSSAAGTLLGLQFIVVTLISEKPPDGAAEATRVYSTPTIVHFSAVLFLSIIERVPWPAAHCIVIPWAIVALVGVVYSTCVIWGMRGGSAYRPGIEDWLFHAVLPWLAYATLLISTFAYLSHPKGALFGIAAGSLSLLFIGIHNAWDAVVYLTFFRK